MRRYTRKTVCSDYVRWRALFDVLALKAGIVNTIDRLPANYPTEARCRELFAAGHTVMDAIIIQFKRKPLKG
jgi:hypothetical protein